MILATSLHSRKHLGSTTKPTVETPENMRPKRKRSSCNHHFSGAMFVLGSVFFGGSNMEILIKQDSMLRNPPRRAPGENFCPETIVPRPLEDGWNTWRSDDLFWNMYISILRILFMFICLCHIYKLYIYVYINMYVHVCIQIYIYIYMYTYESKS